MGSPVTPKIPQIYSVQGAKHIRPGPARDVLWRLLQDLHGSGLGFNTLVSERTHRVSAPGSLSAEEATWARTCLVSYLRRPG